MHTERQLSSAAAAGAEHREVAEAGRALERNGWPRASFYRPRPREPCASPSFRQKLFASRAVCLARIQVCRSRRHAPSTVTCARGGGIRRPLSRPDPGPTPPQPDRHRTVRIALERTNFRLTRYPNRPHAINLTTCRLLAETGAVEPVSVPVGYLARTTTTHPRSLRQGGAPALWPFIGDFHVILV